MPTQPRMSLQTIQFNPTPFQGVGFQAVAPEVSILANSLGKIEERENNLMQQRSVVRQALGEARNQLYASADNNAFIDKKVREIEDNINSFVALGDLSGAINAATDMGSKLATDAELNARLTASKEYSSEIERQRKRVESGDIDQQTFDWWKDTQATWNPTFDIDNNGNVIGLKDSNIAKKAPLKSFDVADLAKAAFSLINPSETTRTSERKWDTRSGDTSGVQSGGGGTRMSSSSKRQVTEKDIRDNMNEILRTSGITFDQLVQYYESYTHHIDVLENELSQIQKEQGIDSRAYKDKLFEKQKYENNVSFNQSEASLELFIARMINDSNYPGTLSYSITSSENRTANNDFNVTKAADETNPTNTGGGNGSNLVEKAPKGTISGNWYPYLNVGNSNVGQQADDAAKQAADNASNLFN